MRPSPKFTLEECGVGRRPQREPAAALAEAQKGEKDAKTLRTAGRAVSLVLFSVGLFQDCNHQATTWPRQSPKRSAVAPAPASCPISDVASAPPPPGIRPPRPMPRMPLIVGNSWNRNRVDLSLVDCMEAVWCY